MRCTRCERPICPDCMREAAVGFQCPDCVSRGARNQREARTAFGGRVAANPTRVTATLIGVNVVVHVVAMVIGEAQVRERFGNLVGPALLPGRGPLAGVAMGEYYRLATATFLHIGFLHLLLNMVSLGLLGPPLEEALGRLRFAAVYALSALGGSVTGYLLAPSNTLSVGASGAIFGLFGAYYLVERRRGRDTSAILVLLAVNLVITFTLPFIDWRAHLGGLAVGGAVAGAIVHAPRGRFGALSVVVACAGIAVLLAGLAVARTAVLTG